ncbi:unnamed protein product [Pieris brassicae]|uniref:Uncharacterized protein n=1 Tax=Pieris brassicae TaxID=7116 RepID=A0A9P0TU07_PIEBR|nr:unnamed protein product [Pieris brassicae]
MDVYSNGGSLWRFSSETEVRDEAMRQIESLRALNWDGPITRGALGGLKGTASATPIAGHAQPLVPRDL